MRIAKNIFLGLVCAFIFTPVLALVFLLIMCAFGKAVFVNLSRYVFGRCEE